MNVQIYRMSFSNLADGDSVQTARVDVYDTLGREVIERLQDYGFAGSPPEGEGLVIVVDGNMFLLRAEMVEGRPELKAWEVAVWHKDGHNITLRDGKVIDVECDEYNVKTKRYNVSASDGVKMDTPVVEASALLKSQTLDVAKTAKINDIDFGTHGHERVEAGPDVSGGPVAR